MSVLNRFLAKIAPQWELKRVCARKKLEILNSGYSHYGASHETSTMQGWLFGGGSHKEDIEDNLDVLRQRSRDLYMGVPLATGALKTCRTNVIGSGLRLKSQIDYEVLGIPEEQARDLERTIEREFALWADTPACDLERLDNFYELQQLAFLNWLMSGDVLALLPVTKRTGVPYDLRIQLIEADRLSNPDDKIEGIDPHVIGGVETNDAGEVIAYYISEHHPLSSLYLSRKWVRVPAWGASTGRRNVIHIMSRERIGQRRGVPFLVPVIGALKDMGRYMDAELVAAVISGCFSIFVQQEADTFDDATGFGEIGDGSKDNQAGKYSEIPLSPGLFWKLKPGETAHSENPGRPNAQFDPFMIAMSRQVGAALEIPYELLLKHFTSSYSASRGALLEAWKMFRMYRQWMANDFCQPIYEEWFAEAVAKGRITAPGFFVDPVRRKAFTRAEWNGPAQGLLNPVQEVNAAENRVLNGFSTRDREAMEMNGSNFYQNVAQLKREESLLQEVKNDGNQ